MLVKILGVFVLPPAPALSCLCQDAEVQIRNKKFISCFSRSLSFFAYFYSDAETHADQHTKPMSQLMLTGSRGVCGVGGGGGGAISFPR